MNLAGNEKFGPMDVAKALEAMAMVRYWPAEPGTRAEIGRLLMRMVPHKLALEWLVRTMVDHIGEWRGPMELRGVLCWRYKPADGIEANCATTPGFTPDDGEAKYIEQAGRAQQALGPAPREIRQLAERKRL